MKILLSACIALATVTTYAQEPMKSPMHASVADRHASGGDMRGDQGMGFSHEKTKHHFEPLPDGGIIQVDVNSENDNASLVQIRQHLTHVALMFTAGNFEIPMFIHDTVPPGVPVMKGKRSEITYPYSETPRGAKVTIVTHD